MKWLCWPLLLELSIVISCLGSEIDGDGEQEERKQDANLYSAGGPVLNLEAGDFYPNVSNSGRSWVVLFYVSWCGHCINYVPTYIAVAENLLGLTKYVQVSAINCAKKANLAVCRDHGIVGYPTVMFLPPHTKNTSSPSNILSEEVTKTNESLIKFVFAKVRSAHPGVTLDRPVKNPLPGKGVIQQSKSITSRSPDILVTQHNSSLLYYEDLVYALRYSLNIEVAGHSEIQGDALLALKHYVSELSKHFPDGNQRISDSLTFLDRALSKDRSKIVSSKQWSLYLNESGIPKHTESTGGLIRCRGSHAKYRGYPCTLWSLFHTLTVQAATSLAANEEEEDMSTKLGNKKLSFHVVSAMRSYIAHFFTCIECKANFELMSMEIKKLEDKSNKDSVLWLWNAHNRVNKRLSGDGSEDPEHPKTQFPSLKLCPLCKTPKGIWDEEVVYDFLQSIYTDIRHTDSPKLIPRTIIAFRTDPHAKHRTPEYVGVRWNSIGMNKADMSMCYAIYIISVLVIGGLFYFVAVRQRFYLRLRRSPKGADQYTGQHKFKPIY